MDIVQHSLPERMWAGINRCRLFLQITTVADIATLDGKVIPVTIKEVTRRLRQSNLLFPVQIKPSAEDIKYWEYLVDFISQNGRLHVPLGRWLRSPDQKFRHLINKEKTRVYKKTLSGWTIFGRQAVTSRRFQRIRHDVVSMPLNCTPVQVIASTEFLIVLTEDRVEGGNSCQPNIYSIRQQQAEQQVLGKFQVDHVLLHRLQQVCHSKDCTLVCATDGGLKDFVGTSSYALFFPREEQAVISGRACEYQPWAHSSSTRQELLGQLGMAYWFDRLQKRWGIPRYQVSIILVTDSQASIDILTREDQLAGNKDVLKLETDIALEIRRLWSQHSKIIWDVYKVESHIEKNSAPNEFYWECNEYADRLATTAREDFTVEESRCRETYVFQGTKIGCKIGKRIENIFLYQVLKEKINGAVLHTYMLEKYSWSRRQSREINWTAHHRELSKFPHTHKVTLYKYIHGWLSTTKRQYRERRSPTNLCPLCSTAEERGHMFTCDHPQMSSIRMTYWKGLVKELGKNTPLSFTEIFIAGTVMGREEPTDTTCTDWSNKFQEAYESQKAIGWEQVMYGRLSNRWEPLANNDQGVENSTGTSKWTSRAIRSCWRFGLDQWTVRNQLVHGTDSGVSTQERLRARRMIEIIYQDLLPNLQRNERALFSRTRSEMLLIPYQSQLAWLGRVKFLCPLQYRDLEFKLLRMVWSSQKIDIQATAQLDTNII